MGRSTSSDLSNRSVLVVPTASTVAALAAVTVWAADPLPVGIVSETTALGSIFRVAATLWGLVLLLTGVRRPRSTLMTFYLAVAVLMGLVVGSRTGYLVSIMITLAILTAAAAAVIWVRRLAVAAACIWPPVALYGAHLYFSGSFERSLPLVIGLALVGVVLGAVLPPIGTALVASSIGAALLLSGLSMNLSFPLIVVVAVGSFVGQAVVVYRLMPVGRDVNHAEASSEKRPSRQFSETLRWGSAVFAALVLVVIFTAPQHGPGTGPRPDRMERLIQQDQLARSGLVISAGNNLYLSGRAFPVAIASKRPGFLSRILLPIAGRDPSRSIREMRAVKDDEELAKMRRAAAITSQAFADIEPLIRPGVNESEIDAAIIESFRRNGATGIAFGSIVGSGPNAVLPHYEKNDAVMDSGMVVIDIGCSVDGYASDMTRSFPVSGDLTAEQRVLVDTVNAAGDAARAILREGVTMGELDRAAREVIEEAGFGPYFLHRLGHHVGLSVHDPHARELKAGMVITIEPGLYISEGADIDPAYWNQGVRIEDSYIVTDDGYKEITFYPRESMR